MSTTPDHYGDEFKATHEQCLKEILRVSQWPQLLLALKPHLDLLNLDIRDMRCATSGRDQVELCKKGGMFYNNYLACLVKSTAKSDQEKAQKRPRIGFWGTAWERRFIQGLLNPDPPTESVK